MKIAVTGKYAKDVKGLKLNLKNYGYSVVEKNPDVAISFGGDGSFLFSEHKYPGVPKLVTRNRSICNKCVNGEFTELMKKISEKKYTLLKSPKLKALVNKGKKRINLLAVSDVIIRNVEQFHAIRFNLFSDSRQINNEMIGDGIVVANSHGSTGYFYSISKRSFKSGIGVALNNTMTKENYYIFKNSKIKFILTRDPASVSVDNQRKVVKLEPGDSVEIMLSTETSKIIKLK
jgi:NAD kinase